MNPKLDYFRCAMGFATSAAVAAQNSGVEQFNNSTGPYVLLVRAVYPSGPTGIQVGTAIQAGPVFTTVAAGVPVPVVAGEATPPGQIRTGSTATPPTFSFQYGASGFAFSWWD